MSLEVDDALLAVRTKSRRALRDVGLRRAARSALESFDTEFALPHAGVEVLRCRARSGRKERRDRARRELRRDVDVQFAGRVLRDRAGGAVLYTENLFVKFRDDLGASRCRALLREHDLRVKRALEYARNAYFVAAPEGTGRKVFAVSTRLLRDASVELCHPELIRRPRRRAAFPGQWHLQRTRIGGVTLDEHANVVAAWSLSEGLGSVIAIIDDGFDIDHEEFAGAGKLVAPRDVTRRSDDPRGRAMDSHGTACAGVACANGAHGASGVAPRAKLMPIRLASGLGSQDEADAFFWAARHDADVISCSWGPFDGDFERPGDPQHRHRELLPDSTRLAIDWAVKHGRNGRGCSITWAAGNGGESVDNDGYASYEKVTAVAACDDRGRQAPYSDFGDAIWCAFPSNHYYPSVTPGIWTTDRRGASGYNWGTPSLGDAAGSYTNSFGGTSSACPGAAGVAALVIARNPDLRWDEVRDVLRRSCEPIDPEGGSYDASGHSPKYGYGRLDARRAVELAAPSRTRYTAIHKTLHEVAIRDGKTSSIRIEVADTKPLIDLKVRVQLEHSFIGDLVVELRPPAAMGMRRVLLHDRGGDATDDIDAVYDVVNTPALGALLGNAPTGTWRLAVSDRAFRDEGRIASLALEFVL